MSAGRIGRPAGCTYRRENPPVTPRQIGGRRPRRRRLGVLEGRTRPKRRGPALALALALAAVVVAATLAVAFLSEDGVSGVKDELSAPPVVAENTTDRATFSLVNQPASRADVVALIGARPADSRRVVEDEVPLECIVYGRRSGKPGEYRFCFRNGYLWTKSAPPLPLSGGGR